MRAGHIGNITFGPPGTGVLGQSPFEVAASEFVQHLKDTEGESTPDAIRKLRKVREIVARWRADDNRPPSYHDYLIEIAEAVKR
jgi:hypothetical protein